MRPIIILAALLLTAAPTRLALHVTVSPNPMINVGPLPGRAVPATLTATASVGALCYGQVRYTTGRRPVSFHAQTVRSSGHVSWRWREQSRGTGGVATVSCRLGSVTMTASTTFVIVHQAG